MTLSMDDLVVFAKTIYGEARGEMIHRARVMVAQVIINRAKRGGWWGNTIREVCEKPYQFSCWNLSDPNRKILERVTTDDPIFLECLGIACMMASGRKGLESGYSADPNLQALTHYCTKALLDKSPPTWAKGRMHDFAVGSHLFFSNVE